MLTTFTLKSPIDNPPKLIPNINLEVSNGNIRQKDSLDNFKAPFDLMCNETLEIPYTPYTLFNSTKKHKSHNQTSLLQEVAGVRCRATGGIRQSKVMGAYPSTG